MVSVVHKTLCSINDTEMRDIINVTVSCVFVFISVPQDRSQPFSNIAYDEYKNNTTEKY